MCVRVLFCLFQAHENFRTTMSWISDRFPTYPRFCRAAAALELTAGLADRFQGS